MMNNELLIKVYNYLKDNPYSVFDKWTYHPKDETKYIHANQWWAPSCFDEQPDFFGCNAQQGMKALNHLFALAGYEPLPEINGVVLTEYHYPFMIVQIGIADAQNQYDKRYVYFFFFISEDGEVRGAYTDGHYQKMTTIIQKAVPLNFDDDPKLSLYYAHLQELLKILWKEIERDDKKLKENALPNVQGITQEEAFDQLFALLNFDNALNYNDLQLLKQDWEYVHHDRDSLMQSFVNRGIIEAVEVATLKHFEIDFLTQLSFRSKFKHYYDDWKFDRELLSDFISENTHFPFNISRRKEIESVRKQLEKETDFSFVDFTNGEDAICLFVVKKQDRKQIQALGNYLGLFLE